MYLLDYRALDLFEIIVFKLWFECALFAALLDRLVELKVAALDDADQLDGAAGWCS